MKNELKIGDKVKYSRDYLRSTGQMTGSSPFARGEILSIRDLSKTLHIATIKWDDPDMSERVNVNNLVEINAVELV